MTSTEKWVHKAKKRLAGDPDRERKAYERYTSKYASAEEKRAKSRGDYGRLAPEWCLGDLSGKRIVIIGENGVGDEILTSSCVRELLQFVKSGQVTWRGDAKLEKLFTRSFSDVEFISKHAPHPRLESTIYSWELIGRLRRELDDFNWTQSGDFDPYLKHAEPSTGSLKARYADDSRKIVGLAWRSQRNGEPLSDKTCDLRDVPHWKGFFEQLKDKVRFVSLQYGNTEDDIAFARWKYGVEIYQDSTVDIFRSVDAAATQIAAVDYVVSISTTTAHLAGALGTPGWVMLAKKPFAHWLAGNCICPWYPTLRPARQKNPGEWQSVLVNIADELAEEVSSG